MRTGLDKGPDEIVGLVSKLRFDHDVDLLDEWRRGILRDRDEGASTSGRRLRAHALQLNI